jgi:hypothetical protein
VESCAWTPHRTITDRANPQVDNVIILSSQTDTLGTRQPSLAIKNLYRIGYNRNLRAEESDAF